MPQQPEVSRVSWSTPSAPSRDALAAAQWLLDRRIRWHSLRITSPVTMHHFYNSFSVHKFSYTARDKAGNVVATGVHKFQLALDPSLDE